MNNNDISLFEKVVFVDNIPSEDNARDLSTRYPFALFISDYGDFGLNGEESELPPTRDWNQFSFNNIWKAGKRLTKFNNVNPEKYRVNMDTFTIDLGFDIKTGLISLTSVAKVNGYNIVGFIQKNATNDFSVYLNKSKIRQDINAGKINNIGITDYTYDMDAFEEFSSTNFEGALYHIDGFDTVNNKIYIIASFYADDVEVLRSVPVNSYAVNCITEEFAISTKPVFIEDKLREILDFDDATEKQDLIDLILKYTENLEYRDYYQRCVVYELDIVKNIEPEFGQNDTSLLTLTFESLKNVENINNIDIEFSYAYVNPIGFELKGFIENEWKVIDQNSVNENYFMPGTATQYSLTILPQYVRKLKLECTLSPRVSGASHDFVFESTNTASYTDYNWDRNDINAKDTTNVMNFIVATPVDFTHSPAGTNNAYRSFLSIKTSDKQDQVRYQINGIKLSQYLFRTLRLENPWNPIGVVTSGQQINYALPNPYAIFANEENTITKERKINNNDPEMTALLIMKPHNNSNVELSTVSNPIIMEDSKVVIQITEHTNSTYLNNIYKINNIDMHNALQLYSISDTAENLTIRVSSGESGIYSFTLKNLDESVSYGDGKFKILADVNKYENLLSTKNVRVGNEIQLVMPWIKSTTEGTDNEGKRRTDDYIYGLYDYHGYEVKDHNKYIKPDELISISILKNNENAIEFTKQLYNGDEDLYIKKLADKPIEFRYYNGQTVNGWGWFINSINDLRNYIKIYSTYGTNRDDESMFNPTVSNNMIKINSMEDIDYERLYFAYIEYNGLRSEEISTRAKRLLVDWWMYIGPFTGSGASIEPSTAFASRNTSLETGFFLKNNDPRNNLNDANVNNRNAIHNGGWIHLGEVDLKTAQYRRYNPIVGGYEQINNQYVIWESSEQMGIDTGTTPNSLQYIMIIPKELRIKDFMNTIGDYIGEYQFTGNKGSYIGYKMWDNSIYLDNNTESTEGFKYYICHELK
jgi:hypothetical protein